MSQTTWSFGSEIFEMLRNMRETTNEENCVACGTIAKIRVSSYQHPFHPGHMVTNIFLYPEFVRHHIAYFPEEVIWLCPSCHNKLSSKYQPELRPPEGEARIFYKGTVKQKETYLKIALSGDIEKQNYLRE